MIPYWLLFLMPAMLALSSGPNRRIRNDGTRFQRFDGLWLMMLTVLIAMIGLRYWVGGDWGAYYNYLDDAALMSLLASVLADDPGYRLLNELSIEVGWNLTGANFFASVLFSVGLVSFCRSLPRPWLALTVAIPYLVIVVAMGYTRQSVALGLVMLGLVSLSRQNIFRFVIYVLLGALFHKSAVIILPIVALTVTRNRFMSVAMVGVATAVGYWAVLADSAAKLVENYIDAGLQSTGALIRLGMNFVPAVLFLLYRNRIRVSLSEYKIWRLFSLMSIAMFIAYFTTSASTALDRVALYMIPLQLFVFSHLPDLMGKQGARNQGLVFLIVGYSATVLLVWLTMGNFSRAWLPYRMSLWDAAWQ